MVQAEHNWSQFCNAIMSANKVTNLTHMTKFLEYAYLVTSLNAYDSNLPTYSIINVHL
jgi:predicted AAA+ superfamily ATPase